jgi:hypothetical protein
MLHGTACVVCIGCTNQRVKRDHRDFLVFSGVKSLSARPWKDHFKSDLRSDQDHLLKKDLRSDQDHIKKKIDLDLKSRSKIIF